MKSTLGIIGAGAFGTALAAIVARSGHNVWIDTEDQADADAINKARRHDRRLPGVELPARVRATAEAGEVARHAQLLVLAVSSRRAREVLPELAAHVDGRHAIVHAIGALVAAGDGADAPMLRVSELVRAHTAVRRVGVIAGPALAQDLAAGRPAALVAASPFDEVVSATQVLLSSPPALRVYASNDLAGAELAAALAGVLTLGLGLADGLGVGPGPRALLVARSLAEFARLTEAAGGEAKTMTGLAGLGNALARSAAGSAEHADDYQKGVTLARGDRPERPSEGMRTVPALVGLARARGVRAPILGAIQAALGGKVNLDAAIARLLEGHAEEE